MRTEVRILLICCLSLFLVGLDITIVNVALPSIGRELDADVSALQWTIDAYTVVLASLLMFAGSLGDRLGRRRVFIVGLSVFSAASALCSLAPGVGFLVIPPRPGEVELSDEDLEQVSGAGNYGRNDASGSGDADPATKGF